MTVVPRTTPFNFIHPGGLQTDPSSFIIGLTAFILLSNAAIALPGLRRLKLLSLGSAFVTLSYVYTTADKSELATVCRIKLKLMPLLEKRSLSKVVC